MEAIGYFRHYPQANQPESFSTLSEQEESFFSFCKEHGYQPAATFIEADGKGSNERGYQQLKEYLQKPDRGFAVVVVDRVEALAPAPMELVRRLLELEFIGVQVVPVESGADALQEAVERWRFLRSGDKLSGRAMDTLRNKAMRGFGLGKPPFAYHIGAQGRLEVVPEEAEVVRRIYGWYLEENLGLRLIARRLNDAGTPTRRGSRWSVVTVRDILRNRTYTGTYARFGVRVPGSHESIVTTEIYREVQRKREATTQEHPVSQETGFALSGLVYCGACGGRMIGVSRRQSWARKRDGGRTETTYRYYRCGSRVNQSVCTYHTCRTDELEESVLTLLGQQLEAIQGQPASLRSADLRNTTRARLRNLELRFKRYLDGAAKGILALDDLRRIGMPAQREMQRLEIRLAELDASPGPEPRLLQATWWDHQQERWAELRERWGNLSTGDKRLYFGDLIGAVTVYDDRTALALLGNPD